MVMIIGNQGAGKTSLIDRIVYDKFIVYAKRTIVCDFPNKIYNLENKILDIDFFY